MKTVGRPKDPGKLGINCKDISRRGTYGREEFRAESLEQAAENASDKVFVSLRRVQQDHSAATHGLYEMPGGSVAAVGLKRANEARIAHCVANENEDVFTVVAQSGYSKGE